ncbi:sensor histidine kinase [Flavitalea sp.]|nr:7TM diverse intracellular signaling domain-containing protein [Flavitalea sp.]
MSNTSSLHLKYYLQRIIPRIIGLLVFCVLAATVFPFNSIAQDSVIEINSFRNLRIIDTLVRYELTEPGTIKDHQIPAKLKFANFLPSKISQNLPADWVEKELFLKFTLANDTDLPRTVSFYPGTYFTQIRIFKATAGAINSTFQVLKDSILPDKNIDGYHPISMQPGEKAVFFARLRFLRSSQNTLVPIIMRADYIDKHKAVAIVKRADLDIVTYIASGMMLMMIIYSVAAFIQNRNKEYLYYALYAFFTGLLLFLISFLGTRLNKFNFFYIEYLDLMILCASVFYYQAFMRTFLDTKNNHPFLEKVFKIGQGLNITMMIIYSIIYFTTEKFFVLSILEDVSKEFFLIIGIIFIIYGIRNKDRLMKYLVAGNIAVVIFSIISFIMLVSPFKFTTNSNFSLLNRPLVYYEIGLVMELMLFLSGLAFKNRVDIIERVKEREGLKLQNERQEFEKQMAVMAAQQGERDRISADMHDELGSGVTAIRLMSEIVKSKLKTQSLPEIEKISHSANELLNKMNTIIWTMKSSNDTLESMIAYIRANATEYFDGTAIKCDVHTPSTIPEVEMSGEKRRNIFLSVKEAMTNIIKHAQATEVSISISTYNEQLVIEVADNGKGMDISNTRRFGNGLANMRRRMESINGSLIFLQQNGTILRFELAI